MQQITLSTFVVETKEQRKDRAKTVREGFSEEPVLSRDEVIRERTAF